MSGLEVRDLTVRFEETTAVDSVSLAVPAGSVVAVLGPSGCGKSTLLRAVAGLEDPTAGQVCFSGSDLAGVPTHRRDFALMFQDGQLFPHLTSPATSPTRCACGTAAVSSSAPGSRSCSRW